MPYEDEDPPYEEPDPELNLLTQAVIGAAIEVHRTLGPGLDEALYERALCIELRLRRISFVRQLIVEVQYKGEDIGEKRIDLIIDGRLVIELKAIGELAEVHEAQVKTYLKITNLTLGLLINFNSALLRQGIRRIVQTQ